MLPGTDFVGTWIGFIFVVGLFVIGIFLFKIISSYVHFPKKSYNVPLPLQWILKVLGTIVYLAVCVIVIAYASQ